MLNRQKIRQEKVKTLLSADLVFDGPASCLHSLLHNIHLLKVHDKTKEYVLAERAEKLEFGVEDFVGKELEVEIKNSAQPTLFQETPDQEANLAEKLCDKLLRLKYDEELIKLKIGNTKDPTPAFRKVVEEFDAKNGDLEKDDFIVLVFSALTSWFPEYLDCLPNLKSKLICINEPWQYLKIFPAAIFLFDQDKEKRMAALKPFCEKHKCETIVKILPFLNQQELRYVLEYVEKQCEKLLVKKENEFKREDLQNEICQAQCNGILLIHLLRFIQTSQKSDALAILNRFAQYQYEDDQWWVFVFQRDFRYETLPLIAEAIASILPCLDLEKRKVLMGFLEWSIRKPEKNLLQFRLLVALNTVRTIEPTFPEGLSRLLPSPHGVGWGLSNINGATYGFFTPYKWKDVIDFVKSRPSLFLGEQARDALIILLCQNPIKITQEQCDNFLTKILEDVREDWHGRSSTSCYELQILIEKLIKFASPALQKQIEQEVLKPKKMMFFGCIKFLANVSDKQEKILMIRNMLIHGYINMNQTLLNYYNHELNLNKMPLVTEYRHHFLANSEPLKLHSGAVRFWSVDNQENEPETRRANAVYRP